MNNLESKVFLSTKLRNLKRKQSRLCVDSVEYSETGNEIKFIERELSKLQ